MSYSTQATTAAHVAKQVGDVAGVSAFIAALNGVLPHILTAVTIIWFVIRIFESRTVQGWLDRRRKKRQGQ